MKQVKQIETWAILRKASLMFLLSFALVSKKWKTCCCSENSLAWA